MLDILLRQWSYLHRDLTHLFELESFLQSTPVLVGFQLDFELKNSKNIRQIEIYHFKCLYTL